jgi:hypothetical protein
MRIARQQYATCQAKRTFETIVLSFREVPCSSLPFRRHDYANRRVVLEYEGCLSAEFEAAPGEPIKLLEENNILAAIAGDTNPKR